MSFGSYGERIYHVTPLCVIKFPYHTFIFSSIHNKIQILQIFQNLLEKRIHCRKNSLGKKIWWDKKNYWTLKFIGYKNSLNRKLHWKKRIHWKKILLDKKLDFSWEKFLIFQIFDYQSVAPQPLVKGLEPVRYRVLWNAGRKWRTKFWQAPRQHNKLEILRHFDRDFAVDPNEKVRLFVRLKRRRDDAVIAGRQSEPGGHLAGINERRRSRHRPVVPEEFAIEWGRSILRQLKVNLTKITQGSEWEINYDLWKRSQNEEWKNVL